jgi:hypothetical protein
MKKYGASEEEALAKAKQFDDASKVIAKAAAAKKNALPVIPVKSPFE